MKLHEREILVRESKSEFLTKYYEETGKMKIKYDAIIDGFSQSLLNLGKEEEEIIILDEHHQKLHDILQEIDKKYDLTYGELVNILSEQITSHAKYVIRFERHGNFDSPGRLQ